jgi:hypothetical protein
MRTPRCSIRPDCGLFGSHVCVRYAGSIALKTARCAVLSWQGVSVEQGV